MNFKKDNKTQASEFGAGGWMLPVVEMIALDFDTPVEQEFKDFIDQGNYPEYIKYQALDTGMHYIWFPRHGNIWQSTTSLKGSWFRVLSKEKYQAIVSMRNHQRLRVTSYSTGSVKRTEEVE